MELRIDPSTVDRCRALARAIVSPVSDFIAAHSTVAVERSVLRLLGVDGVGPDEIPVPNLILDGLSAQDRSRGVAVAFGRGLAETGLDPAALGAAIAAGTMRLADFADVPAAAARGVLAPFVAASLARIRERRAERAERL